ncbi:MAG: ATP-binding cassette domain-containing protein [Actinobacteria bacterium]|uniref:Unannotated protein n=1 Tax=freshwater metagenome TaxID=449393 RepID=A0A6J6SK39_9ZZZZ|nr:ATP-binding cassette domain-containing protein [Actinomycetota bacterium]
MSAPPTTATALLRRAIGRHRGAVLASSALMTSWQVCESLVPVLIGIVIDQAVASGDTSRLLGWASALCLLFAVLSYSYRYGARIGFRALQEETHALRTEVSAHVLDPRGARTDRLPGDVLTIATADADMVGVVIRQLTMTAGALVGLSVSAVALATIDVRIALVVLVGVPLVLALTQALSPRLARRSEARQESIGRATGVATDLVRGLRPLKGIGAETIALERYREVSRRAVDDAVAASRWEGVLHGLTAGLSGLFLAAVALLAGLLAIDGQLSIGELIAVVGLAQFVAEPIALLSYLVAQVAQSRASAQRIVDFLASPPLVLEGDQAAGAAASLALSDVVSGPLRGLSVSIAPGRLVALVVEDPAEAQEIVTLLRGEAVPERGRVELSGAVLTDLGVDHARSLLVVADHHVDLFEGTLLSNVDPAGALSEARLATVVAASAVDDVAEHSADGLRTQVRVGGTSLSGGQRQRLGLARALAADPPVLVLHDPTTAVDAVTEHRIARALRDLRHGTDRRTTLVLTSSPALLVVADEVVHVRAGVAVAVGTHHALVADLGSSAYREAVLR